MVGLLIGDIFEGVGIGSEYCERMGEDRGGIYGSDNNMY